MRSGPGTSGSRATAAARHLPSGAASAGSGANLSLRIRSRTSPAYSNGARNSPTHAGRSPHDGQRRSAGCAGGRRLPHQRQGRSVSSGSARRHLAHSGTAASPRRSVQPPHPAQRRGRSRSRIDVEWPSHRSRCRASPLRWREEPTPVAPVKLPTKKAPTRSSGSLGSFSLQEVAAITGRFDQRGREARLRSRDASASFTRKRSLISPMYSSMVMSWAFGTPRISPISLVSARFRVNASECC